MLSSWTGTFRAGEQGVQSGQGLLTGYSAESFLGASTSNGEGAGMDSGTRASHRGRQTPAFPIDGYFSFTPSFRFEQRQEVSCGSEPGTLTTRTKQEPVQRRRLGQPVKEGWWCGKQVFSQLNRLGAFWPPLRPGGCPSCPRTSHRLRLSRGPPCAQGWAASWRLFGIRQV